MNHKVSDPRQVINLRMYVSAVTLVALAAGSTLAADRPIASGIIPADWPVDMPAWVAVPCPTGIRLPAPLAVRLVIPDRNPIIAPAQFEAADKLAGTPDRIWLSLKLDKSDHGKPVELQLAAYPSKLPDAYQSQRDGEQLHVTTPEDKPILSYWHGKPAPNQKYPLNDFIHPLVGPYGETLTDKSPRDHVHHRGVYWTWVRHEQNGKNLGSWWIPNAIHVDGRELAAADGPVFSRFQARHDWIHQPREAKEGMPFVDEQVVCRVFETTPLGRAMDVEITLTAKVDGVRFGGTTELGKGYGGFSIRYGPATDVRIVADGKPIPKDLNHLRARWADWTGRFKLPNGQDAPGRSGVAFFVAPDHPDSPPEWIARFYGFLNVSYPGLRMLDLPKDKPLRLHYRVWVHRGDEKEGRVDEQYRAYAADWKWKEVSK